MPNKLLRTDLIEILDGKSVHCGIEQAIEGISFQLWGKKAQGLPYTLYELLEHIRLSTRDILEYMRYFLFIAVSVFSLNPLHAQESRKLIVSGSAILSEPADQAVLTIGVVTQDQKIETATSSNDSKMRSIISSLYKTGLSTEEFYTSVFMISPVYSQPPKNPPPDWTSQIAGYEVKNQLRIQTEKLDLIGSIITAASEGGANLIGNIQFSLKDPVKSQTEATRQAIQQAEAYAEAAANAANISLRGILEISVNPSSIVPRIDQSQRVAIMSAQETPIMPGEIDINSSVTMIYEIE